MFGVYGDLTDAERNSLLLSAAQADAHGKIATAQWYRYWAHHGEPLGDKPDEPQAGFGVNAPVS